METTSRSTLIHHKTLTPLLAMLEHLPSVTEATLNAVQAISNATKQAISEKADDQFVVSALVESIVITLLARVSADRRALAATDALALLHAYLDEIALFNDIERPLPQRQPSAERSQS